MYYLLFVFTVFGGMIDFRIEYLNYWDELTLAVVVLLWLKKGIISKVNTDKVSKRLWCLLIFLFGLGLVSNFVYLGIQESQIAIFKDIIAFIKFPVLMLLIPRIYTPKPNKIIKLVKLCKVAIVLTFIIAFVGYFIEMGVYVYEAGRMMKTFELFYRHTTFFVSAYVLILAVFVADSIKKNKMYILATCLLLFLSQRTKAFFVIMVILAIMIIGENTIKKFFIGFIEITKRLRFNKKYLLIVFFMVLVMGWLIGKDKVMYYFSYGLSAARPALYIVGVKIAVEFFPFGSGFGTFASYLSGEYYSNIYDMYNISVVNGLTRDMYAYVGDVFWPYIYGQFGVFGLCGYAYMIYKLFKIQFSKIRKYDTLIAFAIIWIYALFASTAEAYFTNATAVQMAILLKVYISNGDVTQGEEMTYE